jgi:hypothetical protein
VGAGFAENLSFGLIPVFGVVAFDRSTTLEEFSGAATDCFLELGRIIAGGARHIRTASMFQGF